MNRRERTTRPIARCHGPHNPIAFSPGMVTGSNPATWAGRVIAVSLWKLALLVPFPVYALGLVLFPVYALDPGPLALDSWVN